MGGVGKSFDAAPMNGAVDLTITVVDPLALRNKLTLVLIVGSSALYVANAPVKAGREPDSGTAGNCAVIYPTQNWAFADDDCGTKRGYPICSRTPLHGHCGQPFVLVGTQCVHVIQAGSTWAAARTLCGLLGGDLIILDDCHQYRKVYLYLTEKGYKPVTFWIGGSDLAVEGQWRWIDGSPMAMGVPYWGNTGAGAPEPNNPGVENCMELSSAWMYRFSNTLCNNTRRVVCETHPL
ncbi:type-2 ice-structuring protein-like [Hyalella azteca]|uniref:Type-2 ice-structuring protein-like n=1 Tax=Hyalella azteca TaxID=294128 RepID=A0A979FY11_HYAAZ|nr:type-2 ice-structuring protein-like [Hyalella azteca]